MRVLVTGSGGLLGHAIQKQAGQFKHQFTFVGRRDADLENKQQTDRLIEQTKPEAILNCAAVVGGIRINMESPEQMRDRNRAINVNVIEAAKKYNVKKVVSFLSTCVFPENAPEPWDESMIHAGEPDRRQWGYAEAKRELDLTSRRATAESKIGARFVTLMPSTLYGPNDNFSPENGHVLPAVILKIHQAKTDGQAPVFWGSGNPRREFLFVNDMADVAIETLDRYNDEEPLIVSPGGDVSVKSLVNIVSEIIGYAGPVNWDTSKPDGRLTRRTNNAKFLSRFPDFQFTAFDRGLRETIDVFLKNFPQLRGLPRELEKLERHV